MPTPKRPKKAHQTRYGEGSFKWNPQRQLWVGRYDTGRVNSKGTRLVVTASSRDEDTAWQKFLAAKKKYLIEGPRPEQVKPNQTVAGWCKIWQTSRIGRVRPKTLASDNANIRKWIIPQIGPVALEDLTAAHMREIASAVRKEGKSLSTANSAQRTLSKLLRAAVADGYKVPERIFAQEKAGRGTSERKAMSKLEVAKVFTKAYEMYPDAIRLFLAVLYGSRQNEILGLTWDRIIFYNNVPDSELIHGAIMLTYQVQQLPKDPTTGEYLHKDEDEVIHLVDSWHLVPTKTKSGQRELPMIKQVASELKTWKTECPEGEANPNNLVFPRISGMKKYLGYPRNPKQDLSEWKQVQEAAGVYKRKPDPERDEGEFYLLHEARHSMISMLADAGTPDHIIEMLVGQTKLVRSYLHGDAEVAANAINDVLAPLLPESRQTTHTI
ncbi:MAG: site-specific integrase [Ancrocorticia sp.]|jgi:integrase|nr:site-specific integrase [Ancrocorticia sp.]MCI1962873.1 site-specific integrase [Ancrocorticia sp.]MCI2001847.1 site-specific integrase [Ancrocorticia sp.]MCI2001900.1 site-specific integrase [Ancrocorticia sp.]